MSINAIIPDLEAAVDSFHQTVVQLCLLKLPSQLAMLESFHNGEYINIFEFSVASLVFPSALDTS